jgi:tRNA dimethylallyltransferase
MKLIVITGPTATGKTKLAASLAKKYDGELINADSRQVYKYLDIVTGKDKKDIDIPIHLYDIVDPRKTFSAFDWVALALKTINYLKSRRKLPIIVGGSYFYLKNLLYSTETAGVPADWILRKSLAAASIHELQDKLKKINKKLYLGLSNAERNNPQRLIRKIEIYSSRSPKPRIITGLKIPISQVKFIGLNFKNKEDLRKSIEKRVRERIKQGAVEEVRGLLSRGYKVTDPGLSANACLEIAQFIVGEITQDELIEKWVTLEMQYAKRQMTFMKTDENIKWKSV